MRRRAACRAAARRRGRAGGLRPRRGRRAVPALPAGPVRSRPRRLGLVRRILGGGPRPRRWPSRRRRPAPARCTGWPPRPWRRTSTAGCAACGRAPGTEPAVGRGTRPFGVYVHVPFCASRCDYCAFATYTDRDHLMDRLRRGAASPRSTGPGATGSSGPADAASTSAGARRRGSPAEALAGILGAVPAAPGAEVTVECNPEDADAERVRRLPGGRGDPGVVRRAVHGRPTCSPTWAGATARPRWPRPPRLVGEAGFATLEPRPHLRRRRRDRRRLGRHASTPCSASGAAART